MSASSKASKGSKDKRSRNTSPTPSDCNVELTPSRQLSPLLDDAKRVRQLSPIHRGRDDDYSHNDCRNANGDFIGADPQPQFFTLQRPAQGSDSLSSSPSNSQSSSEDSDYRRRYEGNFRNSLLKVVFFKCPGHAIEQNKCRGKLRFYADHPGGQPTSVICSVCPTYSMIAKKLSPCSHCQSMVEPVSLLIYLCALASCFLCL